MARPPKSGTEKRGALQERVEYKAQQILTGKVATFMGDRIFKQKMLDFTNYRHQRDYMNCES